MELEKPWFSLEGYKKTRLLEARYELELAKRFMEEGLLRNAAGKIFQAWKAYVGALAVDKVEELERIFPGFVRLRNGRRVKRAYWALALIPTTRLWAMAEIVGGEVYKLTAIALFLHEYQYNGLDAEGILSPYTDEEHVKRDIARLAEYLERALAAL